MSDYVSDAEIELVRTLDAMQHALAAVLRNRTVTTVTPEEASEVSLSAVVLSKQEADERERVTHLAAGVQRQMWRLQQVIGNFPEENEARLDAELRHLNTQYVDLSQKIIAQYDTAAQLCHSLESEVLATKVPNV
mmetsp:Transcript_56234/g.64514  ORF Transcript_56234/g.64514 Transcript_56234/m.64514 type:complete len:135 (+) Transcript_56234:121-525(+)